MKKLIVSLLVLTAMLSAAIVDANRAQKVAENYYKNYAPESAKSNTVKDVLTKEYMGQPTWYVIQFTEGFVIVSADDAVRPILGYSFDGYVDKDLYNMQNPFVHRFGFYDRQIVHDVRESGMKDVKAATEWKEIETNSFAKASKAVVVDALSPYNWGQDYPWNNLCPDGAPVGCVATAMHIIMRTHMGPDRGYSSHSYTDFIGALTGSHSVDFSAQTYDWPLIDHVIDYGDVATTAEEDELAKLSYHCGVSVDMDYESDGSGSGAYTSDVPAALETYFGFDTSGTYSDVGTVTDPTTNSTVMWANLDAGRPMELSGRDATYGGHAYVCDGYTDDYYYHFNWGWDGAYNGWFQLTNLTAGAANFSSSQGIAYNLFVSGIMDSMPPAENLQGSLANGEDVSLTWDAPPTGAAYRTLTGYNVYRTGVLVGNTAVGTRNFTDNDLSEGSYLYVVKATYEYDGESYGSNAYDISVVADENYPEPSNPTATTNGRVSIDVAWVKPFLGAVYYETGYETGNVATDWKHERTTDYPPTGAKIGGQTRDNFTLADITDGWFHGTEATFGDPQYIHSGLNFMGITYGNPMGSATWAFSPEFTLGANAELTYWHWFMGGAESGGVMYYTDYRVNLYNGDFTESDPSANLTEILAFTQDVNDNNQYETQIVADLSAYTGTYRLGFAYIETDGWQTAIDDIIIGTATKRAPEVSNVIPEKPDRLGKYDVNPVEINNLPLGSTSAPKADVLTGYEVYRNGTLATTISDPDLVTWNDTGFIDGWNEYYVKATYQTGSSVASLRALTYLDANPVPGYLTDSGVFDANADLSWYVPYHYPPMWFGYETAADPDNYWDCISEYDANGDGTPDFCIGAYKNRTLFISDLGIYYPSNVDSIAACFYEPEAGYWNSDQFTYAIYTSAYDGSDSLLYGPTASQTAVSGYWNVHGLTSTLVMNQGWYVEVTPADAGNKAAGVISGTPSLFTSFTDDTHSTTYLDVDNDGTEDSWYSITSGDVSNEWWIDTYITSGPPPAIVKDNWVKPVDRLTVQAAEKKLAEAREISSTTATTKSKEMLNYNIYRDGALVGTSATTSYQDTGASAGFHDYYVTALYANPAGESAASNTVNVEIDGSGPIIPAVPANVATSIVGTDLQIDWDVSADATGYDVYASDDPYAATPWAFVTSVATNQYTVAADQAKLFYYIVATNATKTATKVIKVNKPVKVVK